MFAAPSAFSANSHGHAVCQGVLRSRGIAWTLSRAWRRLGLGRQPARLWSSRCGRAGTTIGNCRRRRVRLRRGRSRGLAVGGRLVLTLGTGHTCVEGTGVGAVLGLCCCGGAGCQNPSCACPSLVLYVCHDRYRCDPARVEWPGARCDPRQRRGLESLLRVAVPSRHPGGPSSCLGWAGRCTRRNRIEARPARGRRDAPGEAQRPGSLGLCLAVCGRALALCGVDPGLCDAGCDGVGDGAAGHFDHDEWRST